MVHSCLVGEGCHPPYVALGTTVLSSHRVLYMQDVVGGSEGAKRALHRDNHYIMQRMVRFTILNKKLKSCKL
jgi:hypothetical protein